MDDVANIVLVHGYLLVFAIVFLDQAAVSIPSPPFVAAMGALASAGRFNIWLAFIVVLVAAFLADYLWFRIGLSAAHGPFKPACFRHWDQNFPRVGNLIQRGVLGAIVGVKFSLIPSALVPFAVASTGITKRRFLYVAVLSNLTWTSAYLIGGFTGGHAIINLLGRSWVLITAAIAYCLLLIAAFGAPLVSRHCRAYSSKKKILSL
jgi:membrane protein DedA with SNARE-associated domain